MINRYNPFSNVRDAIILFLLWVISIFLFGLSYIRALETSVGLEYNNVTIYLSSLVTAIFFWSILKSQGNLRITIIATAIVFLSTHIYSLSLEKLPLSWIRVLLLDITLLRWVVLTLFFMFIFAIAEFMHTFSWQYISIVGMMSAPIVYSFLKIENLAQLDLRINHYPLGIFITTLAFSIFLASYHEFLRSLSHFITMEITGEINES